MKVKVIQLYNDTVEKKLIKAGTEMTVSAERGQTLINAGVAEEIKEPVENVEKPVKSKGKKK